MKDVRYLFISTFAIKAPLLRILPILIDYSSWPLWWKGLQDLQIETTKDPTRPHILCSVGFVFYQLHFTLIPKSISKDTTITMHARGDLKGTGIFTFAEKNDQTRITFTWNVATTKLWMNLIAPLAKPLFVREHNTIMTWFAKGLAKQLQAKLIFIKHTQKA